MNVFLKFFSKLAFCCFVRDRKEFVLMPNCKNSVDI